MMCPNCKVKLREVKVKVEGARHKIKSFQCPKCDYVKFDNLSANKVITELRKKESPLTIKQKITKVSKNRLGIYFSQDIVRSLDLKQGENVYISIPDENHIILYREKAKVTT